MGLGLLCLQGHPIKVAGMLGNACACVRRQWMLQQHVAVRRLVERSGRTVRLVLREMPDRRARQESGEFWAREETAFETSGQ